MFMLSFPWVGPNFLLTIPEESLGRSISDKIYFWGKFTVKWGTKKRNLT